MGAIRKHPPSFVYSLVLHAAFFAAWAIYSTLPRATAPSAPPKFVILEVEPLAKPAERASKNSQVVQTESGRESEKAAPDAFLGERTQTVERQTVSSPKTGDAPATSRGADPSKAVADAQAPAEKAPEPKAVIQSEGALAKFGIAIDASNDHRPKPKALNPAEEAAMTAQARGEYVKGFQDGEQTMLNTKEFVFFGYFQRLRERLDRAWDRSLRDQLTKYFYKGRQLASETDYTTQLMVSLDARGRIIRVQVIGASGTRDLDEAAIKAFNAAGPFPNPPRGLLDGEEVRVRWDFVLRT